MIGTLHVQLKRQEEASVYIGPPLLGKTRTPYHIDYSPRYIEPG